MASTKEFLNYVLEQASNPNLTYRNMMGGYLLYINGTIIGGIYADRLLVKMVENNKKYNMEEVVPYEGSKKLMYYVTELDNRELLNEILEDTYEGL